MVSPLGVGVRNYQAGPTQCTKMRVYRPKTCGIVPKPLKQSCLDRPQSSICEKKMGPMDLAICWDYRPFDPRDEPKPPAHIDGSNGSAAPAVFAIVKTPRQPNPETAATSRSTGALFASTLGEESFFDKDLVTRNKEYNEKYSMQRNCKCGNDKGEHRSVRHSAGGNGSTNRSIRSNSSQRPKTTSRQGSAQQLQQQMAMYKSSPNLSQIDQMNEEINKRQNCHLVCINHNHGIEDGNDRNLQRYKSQPDLEYSQRQRIPRECHKANAVGKVSLNYKPELRPFRAGVPQNSNSFDSGCSSGMTADTTAQRQHVRVPKPRDPYAPKNYNINTLAPPFACWKGGSGQGGYPEHWRLASVYQHAYKPIDQRRRPLLQTVYQ